MSYTLTIFFTSYALLLKLRDEGLNATGTAREGRLGGGCFSEKRTFQKEDRGSYEYSKYTTIYPWRTYDVSVLVFLLLHADETVGLLVKLTVSSAKNKL